MNFNFNLKKPKPMPMQKPRPHMQPMMQPIIHTNTTTINNNTSNINIPSLFNNNLTFYVCSSGGCGSTLIHNYLKMFGNVFHIHDRFPPDKLCYVGSENTNNPVYEEWFNTTEIPNDKLHAYKVLFIYRNPIDVIYSRCVGPNIPHLQHIKCDNDGDIPFIDVIQSGKDLYKLEDFFDNYTIPKKRNYTIYCVKYEEFFNNISWFNSVLNIPNIKELYPKKNEKHKQLIYIKDLIFIYHSLMKKMNNMKFIEIIKPNCDENFNLQI